MLNFHELFHLPRFHDTGRYILFYLGCKNQLQPFFGWWFYKTHPIQMVNLIICSPHLLSSDLSAMFPCKSTLNPHIPRFFPSPIPASLLSPAAVLLRLFGGRGQRGQRHLQRLHPLRHHAAQARAKGAEEGQVLGRGSRCRGEHRPAPFFGGGS